MIKKKKYIASYIILLRLEHINELLQVQIVMKLIAKGDNGML